MIILFKSKMLHVFALTLPYNCPYPSYFPYDAGRNERRGVKLEGAGLEKIVPSELSQAVLQRCCCY